MYENGFHYVCDISTSNKTFLTYNELQSQTKTKINFLTYQGLVSSINSYRKKCESKKGETFLPCLQTHVDIILKHSSGARDMYNVLCSKQKDKPTCIDRWENKVVLQEKDWKKIFSLPFKTTCETKLQWFQYRINHYIIGTNVLLHKINSSSSPLCQFCETENETVEHIFWECEKIQDLLENFDNILCQNNINLNYSKEQFIFGFYNNYKLTMVNNIILLNIKYYIYKCKMQCVLPSTTALLNALKNTHKVEREISINKNILAYFEKDWKPWTKLLN